MRQLLKLHPDSCCVAAVDVEVEIARPHIDRLVLCYVVTGTISKICMPPVIPAARRGELWRHSCFEAFLGTSSGATYYEFNFAPSTEWAAYRFDGYRSGMCVAAELGAPVIDVRLSSDACSLRTSLALDRLSALSRDDAWRLGLSAVIEDTSGGFSYWALTHPPGKPDFHHADCFAYEFLPAAQA